jgi:mono/diheme cytochrome c family protein
MSTLSRALVLVVFVLLAGGGAVIGIATHRINQVHDLPAPPIVRAAAPDEIARGGRLFRTLCLDCHAGPAAVPGRAGGDARDAAAAVVGAAPPSASTRVAAGARVASAPAFLGELWAPNITGDVTAGVGGWSDGELARLLRNGLRRDGRYAATMPRFPRLADEDVAAIIGFMRSGDPLVAPVATRVPPSRLGLGGILALAYAAGVDTSGPAHVAAPPRAPSAEYGRYLAGVIYGCVDCHTTGVGTTEEKLAAPGLLAGGLVLHGPDGAIVYSRNLTPDRETGLGAWSVEDFGRALREGTSRSGRRLRPPMPLFGAIDDLEAQAIFAFVRSVPPVHGPSPADPAPAPPAQAGDASPQTAGRQLQ